MRGWKSYLFCFGIGLALAVSTGVAQAACNTVSNTVTCTGGTGASISFASTFPSTPYATHTANVYPTTITVAGGAGTVSSLTITIHGYSGSAGGQSDDFITSKGLGLLLKSPSARNMQILRGPGAGNETQTNLTFTIQDGAAVFPTPGAWTTGGTFAPSAYSQTALTGNVSPNYGFAIANSPQTIGTSTLNSTNGVFGGDTVNGNWSLYMADDADGAAVSFTSWDIAITFSNATTPSTTTLTPNPTTAFRTGAGSTIVLTATVTTGATGTVLFKNGANNLTCNEGSNPPGRPLSGGNPNTAVCTVAGWGTEGIQGLSANYSGDGTFVASSGTANVYIRNHATNVGSLYCNAGVVSSNGNSDVAYSNTLPYPSVIFVGDGINTDIPVNQISTVKFTAKNLSSTSTLGLKMLLVSPDGTHTLDFWSDAGTGTPPGTGDYTIQDGSPQLSSNSSLSPGTYGPTAYAGGSPDVFTPGPPAPAPQVPGSFFSAAPAGSPNSKVFASAFTGATGHGAWSLFMYDASGATTNLNGGWCLDITQATGHPTTVTLMSSPTNATFGSPVTFTATIASTPAVGNVGTVTFTEDGAPLTGAPNNGVANVVNGVAMIVTISLPEGDHLITAQYHDNSNTFNDNFGSVTMRVDKATSTPTLNGSTWSYCNTGAIVIPRGTLAVNDIGQGTPNPSNVFVTNLPGTINSVGLNLKAFHITKPIHLNSLLVGPGATTNNTLDFFSLGGGINAFGPQDTGFFDAFAAAPQNSPPASNNGPASYGATSYFSSQFYTLPGAFQHATTAGAFTFNTNPYTPNVGGGVYKNTLPNGTWSLYFNQTIDHHSGDGLNGGWCMAFTENPVTVSATKSHTAGRMDGNFQQGQQSGASFSFNITNNGDANGMGSTGDPDCMHPLTVVDVLDGTAFTAGTLPTGSACTVGMPPPTDWNCTGTTTVTCKNHAAIAPMGNYAPLTIPVIVKNAAPASATNQASLSGGGITATMSTSDMVTIDPAPILAITKGHMGTFTQGQTATWTLQVTNTVSNALGTTNGSTVTVTDTLPTGYTGWSGSGTGWMCMTNSLVITCTSNDVVAGNGGLFGLITLTGTVPTTSSTMVTNNATVYGGGDVVHFNSGNAAMGSEMVTVIQVPASITTNANTTPQSAQVTQAYGTALSLTVKDAAGVTIPNESVTFTAATGGNNQSGTFANMTNTVMVNTDMNGVATATAFTANTKIGAFTVSGSANTGSATPATFNLTNTAGPPTQMTANTNTTPQTAQVTQAFGTALGVTVLDAQNNPVMGVMVTFTAPVQTGASGKFANNTGTTTVATDVNGVATATTFTANTHAGGPYNVAATATGPPTVNFAMTNTPGPPTVMTTNANTTPQSAQVTQAFGTLLGVTVTDANSNPVMGVMVTFTAPVQTGASGLFANMTGTTMATTDVNGVATATAFTANTHAGGPYNVAATATGPPTANFALTNTPGPATQMNTNANTTPQSAQVTQAFGTALGVTVLDANNNGVQGVMVTFTAPASGASGKFANNTNTTTATTDANGVATATTFTANTLAGGPYNVTGMASGLTTVNFALTNTAGAATQMTANANTTPQTAQVTQQFGTLLGVTVKDAQNNPVMGVMVTFTAPAQIGASGLFANMTGTTMATTDVNGVATATAFTANTHAGGPYNVAATATGPPTVNFALTNTAGSASQMTATANTTPQSAQVTQQFGTALGVKVTDGSSNPIMGVLVTFTAPASGASGTFANMTITTQATTDVNGVATASAFTANTLAGGPYNVAATASGLTTVNFALTNTVGPPTQMTANANTTPQSAQVTQAFGTLLGVTVKDAQNNPIMGVLVTFTAPASGASGKFANNTNTTQATTDVNGVATATTFTANAQAGGPYNVTAMASGLTTVNFALTNTAGSATQMTANANTTPQSAQVTQAFGTLLGVTVKDGSNNPIMGVLVTFTAPASGASGKFANNTNTTQATTDVNGVATATTFTANGQAGGPYNVTAMASGLTTVNFALTNTVGPPTQMTANANTTPQSATINTQFGTLLGVTVKDAGNNPIQGLLVTFTAPNSGASGLFANNMITTQATTDVNGVATATAFTANGTVGGPYNVAAMATGLTTVNFALTNSAATVQVTVNTNINGPTISVDGGMAFTGSQMFTWNIGSSHSLSTSSPQTNAGTQYIWLNWSDMGAITHNVTAPSMTATYTATFKTQYQLTTTASPNTTEGSISPATGFYDSGSVVSVSATANAGYVFTGFTGALSGTTTPQNVTMNSAQSVTANFQPGPTSLGGSFTAKTGPQNARVWTVTVGNNRPGAAVGTQITSFTLQQTSGTPCTPVVTTPMPALVGDIAPSGTRSANVTLNFTGCTSNPFFTVTVNLSANNGAAAGQIKRTNQLQ